MARKKDIPARPPIQVPLSERTAEELAVLAARDNVAAFAELVVRFEARLFNFLLRRVTLRADAEDLTQEAFVRAWERIEFYDPTWRFSTWLFTIASRLAVSKHRRDRPAMHIESAEQVFGKNTDDGSDPELNVRRGGVLWDLASEILKPEQHTALWLRYAEDMGVTEIARVLRKSQVGVRVCLFRARQTLAKAAKARGYDVEELAEAGVDAAELTGAGSERSGGGRVPSVGGES